MKDPRWFAAILLMLVVAGSLAATPVAAEWMWDGKLYVWEGPPDPTCSSCGGSGLRASGLLSPVVGSGIVGGVVDDGPDTSLFICGCYEIVRAYECPDLIDFINSGACGRSPVLKACAPIYSLGRILAEGRSCNPFDLAEAVAAGPDLEIREKECTDECPSTCDPVGRCEVMGETGN
ncbi:MAG: hypothetical protein HYV63_22735 [Candidatus Schekmanbacteria bacterium]|nr:hypothetical protein [Candidatus Schekmanbacteria bacterium]